MYWLFNGRFFNLLGKGEETLTWEQSRNFKGEEGDRIVFFRFDSKNRLFTYLFNLTGVDIKYLSSEQDPTSRKLITITLQLIEDFKDEKEIEDYLYSFPRIVYFESFLYRHFNRKYYRLSEEEFNAIVKDEIFEARSIIGTALNAMHLDHRRAFVNILIDSIPGILQNKYRHDKVLILLKDYLQYAVVIPAKQLTEAFKDLEGVIDEGIRLQIGFSQNETTSEIDRISRQVELINESLERLQSSLVINDIEFSINRKFEKIFRNRPLPIDLIE